VNALLPPLPQPENQPPVFRAGHDCAPLAQPPSSSSANVIAISRPVFMASTA
jgi:hypothetical protein